MEIILKELEKARPSKKVLRQELAKIQKLLDLVDKGVTDISEFDESIHYNMIVRNEGEHGTWFEEVGNSHRYSEEEIIKNALSTLDVFNKTLRPLEKRRELVRIDKHIKYEQKQSIWQLS